MTKEERCAAANAYHANGMNCGQSVLAAFQDMIGLTEEQCFSIASGLGAGMQCGNVCGAASGSVMVLGMLHPHNHENDPQEKAKAAEITKGFLKRFEAQFEQFNCRELLPKKDIVGTAMVEKLGITKHCPMLIVSAVELLCDYLEELEKE